MIGVSSTLARRWFYARCRTQGEARHVHSHHDESLPAVAVRGDDFARMLQEAGVVPPLLGVPGLGLSGAQQADRAPLLTEGLAHLVGDYLVQSDWLANEKTNSHGAALLHGASYAACFLPLTRNPKALLFIGGTHYVIDHWRLAKYVIWAKNQIAPAEYRYPYSEAGFSGYHRDRPDWLAGWLLFLADNTIHACLNRWALRRWGGR